MVSYLKHNGASKKLGRPKYGSDIHKNLLIHFVGLCNPDLFFKILSLCAEAHLELSQMPKGLIIWIFSSPAKNFKSVKQVEKKNIYIYILYGVFQFGLNLLGFYYYYYYSRKIS